MKYILILLFIGSFCYAQNIRAVYKKTFLSVRGDNTTVPENMKPSLHTYEYSKGRSIYKIYSSIKSSVDTIDMETQGIKHELIREVVVPDEDTYYKDLKNNLVRREFSMGGKETSVKDKLEKIDWKLTNEVKEIKGYKCKKATALFLEKYSIDAWYCEDIPINDGPSFFWGLPGLIIEVSRGNNYTISLVDLKIVNEKMVIEEPIAKSKMITNEELSKMY